MKTIIFGAGSDLGVHMDGSHLGPTQLINDLKGFFKGEVISLIQDEGIIKSRNLSDKRKNSYELENFNTKLYNNITKEMSEGTFPITVGGDRSVSISSALAAAKTYENIGIIYITSHTSYNTFETTVTGNIHGLALAAINGTAGNELKYYHDGKTIPGNKTVVVGARNIEEWEKENIKYSGITVFSTEDIHKEGVKTIMEKAFAIAGNRTKGIHVTYDLDVIDPDLSPGVSVPEFDGITVDEAMEVCDEVLERFEQVTSFDLVEFNPLRDVGRKTEQIAVNILAKVIQRTETKK